VLSKGPTYIDQKVDVFAWGVMLGEIVTVEIPDSRKPGNLKFPAGAPKLAVELFEQCTQPRRAERPTCAQLVERLLRDGVEEAGGGGVGG
jgi:hypothetical protein